MNPTLVFIFKYAWIFVIGAVEIFWLVMVVKDFVDSIIYCIRNKYRFSEIELEDYTKAFFIVNLMLIFLVSFMYWIGSHCGG